MEQKVVITNSQYDVQTYIDKGWRVVSVTAQHVSAGTFQVDGKFCFILERDEN